jgi:thiamine biosynthesis lipoprotein
VSRTATLALFSHPFKAMGSPCDVRLYASDRAGAAEVAERVIADVARLEARYSRYREESLLSAINRVAAAGGAIEVDDETAGLLRYADACYRESDGLFDITSGLLRRAWRFDRGALPAAAEIEPLLARIGWDRVRWTPPRLEFPPGMEIDFGGIVKEYAADRAATICRDAGIRHGVVNLGGDIRIVGPQPDDRPWRIGVRHPRRREAAAGTLVLRAGAVATSGDYERCIVIADRRFGHVLNPRTGWPVQHLASVTVVGELCVVAGSASTIAMLKETEGPRWLERLGLPHLWIDVDGNAGGSLAPGLASDAPDVG